LIQWRGAYTSQDVHTIAGQTYTLTFDAAARTGDSSAVLEVIIMDQTNGSQLITLMPAITDAAFTPFFLNFTAPSGLTNIEFLNNSPSGIDDTVDVANISLISVSEPATVSLFVIGALATLMVVRKCSARIGESIVASYLSHSVNHSVGVEKGIS
jgi:hypothetical protein